MAEPFALTAPEAPMRKGAEVSACGRYRFSLWRIWDQSLLSVCWCLLNPSTADGNEDDPTVRRCIEFSRRWGFGGIHIVNLFPLRATDPKALRDFKMAPESAVYAHRVLIETAEAAARCIVGWGDSGRERAKDA